MKTKSLFIALFTFDSNHLYGATARCSTTLEVSQTENGATAGPKQSFRYKTLLLIRHSGTHFSTKSRLSIRVGTSLRSNRRSNYRYVQAALSKFRKASVTA
ncbi:hypothetical protein NPIL_493861 [Nephila pilipes]|uniref:Uncharacterized protein n=1 Tax=Nephila pilipes TaxID=299642 RepID=A0A8X6Q5Z6_NEPPI|nr:hypothetical protein NPIL_493861 [Nephila pilipes]